MEFSILLLVNCGRVPSIQGGIIHSWCELTQHSSKRHAAVADLGEGPWGARAPPLFFAQNEAEKEFLVTAPPYLRVWLTPPPPPLI